MRKLNVKKAKNRRDFMLKENKSAFWIELDFYFHYIFSIDKKISDIACVWNPRLALNLLFANYISSSYPLSTFSLFVTIFYPLHFLNFLSVFLHTICSRNFIHVKLLPLCWSTFLLYCCFHVSILTGSKLCQIPFKNNCSRVFFFALSLQALPV